MGNDGELTVYEILELGREAQRSGKTKVAYCVGLRTVYRVEIPPEVSINSSGVQTLTNCLCTGRVFSTYNWGIPVYGKCGFYGRNNYSNLWYAIRACVRDKQ